MKALLQVVTNASVAIDGQIIASIDYGLLVFLGIERGDTKQTINKMVHRVVHYRIFTSETENTNINVQQAKGSVLVVSQFTLAAVTTKGLRPDFGNAESPQRAKELYQCFIRSCSSTGVETACGKFGAVMKVSLVNNGPVTLMLEL